MLSRQTHTLALKSDGPSRCERLLNAGSEGPIETTVVELRALPRERRIGPFPDFAAVGDMAAIAFSSHGCSDIGQHLTGRVRSLTPHVRFR